jgi:hypothetical protein
MLHLWNMVETGKNNKTATVATLSIQSQHPNLELPINSYIFQCSINSKYESKVELNQCMNNKILTNSRIPSNLLPNLQLQSLTSHHTPNHYIIN